MILGALTHQSSPIEVGASYRRFGTGAFVETAHVLEVASDKLGIPHVRFQLQVTRGAGRPTVETRTLALEAFQNRFRDRVREKH
ncbi:MAG: hypothetical protein WC654_08340 [Patescibacteria group bacterium]